VPINEPLIGWYVGPFLCDLPGFSAEALDDDEFTLRRVQAKNRAHFFNDEFRDVWQPRLGELMRARFLAHARRHPARAPIARTTVVVKEPNGSQSADVLMAAMPRSRLLFLLRDGRDVVDSEVAANEPGSWVSRQFPGFTGIERSQRLEFVVQSAKKWLWRTAAVQRAYAAHTGPKLLVRYEELRDDPQRHVRAVVDWLGLRADDATIADVVARHAFERIPAGNRGPHEFHRAARPGLWQQNLTPEEQAAVHDVLGPKLAELGYTR
jgi:hypothetical protein